MSQNSYKEKLERFIKYANSQTETLSESILEYEKKIKEIDVFRGFAKNLEKEGEDSILNSVLEDNEIIPQLNKQKSLYMGRIENHRRIITKLNDQMNFVRVNLCPHENSQCDETNYHTRERIYKCLLCGARLY